MSSCSWGWRQVACHSSLWLDLSALFGCCWGLQGRFWLFGCTGAGAFAGVGAGFFVLLLSWGPGSIPHCPGYMALV
ncbi:hypothetical protein L208DRAFT_1404992 [Tricholoma matsutake]|nr:hypothetical protein L208DRAFT_1404992 [Tricholoma matsutake 945]